VKRRFPVLAFVFVGLLSSEAMAQTPQTPLTVTVEGATWKPGTYQMNSGLTLLTLVAMAGGLQPSADSSMIQVVRLKEQAADSNLSENIFVDFRRIISGKVRDFQLRPGDVIFIPFSFSTPRLPADPPVTPPQPVAPPQKHIARVEINQI
jgi:protein involved in polysaccharide export with SLBB domain